MKKARFVVINSTLPLLKPGTSVLVDSYEGGTVSLIIPPEIISFHNSKISFIACGVQRMEISGQCANDGEKHRVNFEIQTL